MYLLIPNSKFIPPPHFPFGNHQFVLYVCESISVLQINSFVKKKKEEEKKITDTKGTFHAKMGSVKDRN